MSTSIRRRRPGTPVELAAARAGSLSRWRGPDAPETVDARRNLAETMLVDYVSRVVENFPALRSEQITRISALLRSSPEDGQ